MQENFPVAAQKRHLQDAGIKSTVSVEIALPIREVFQYTLHNIKEWSSIVVEDEPLEPGQPVQVGYKFLTVTEEKNGHRMEFKGEVTQHEEPTVHTVKMIGQVFDIEAQYLFEKLGTMSTRVTQHSNVTGKGFFKLMFGLIGWLMQKQGCQQAQNELDNLKRIMEERPRQRNRPTE